MGKNNWHYEISLYEQGLSVKGQVWRMNSRVVRRSRGCRVFVEERPGVATATTIVSNSIDARDSGHASLFGLHLDLRVVAAAGRSLATALPSDVFWIAASTRRQTVGTSQHHSHWRRISESCPQVK